MDALYIFPRRGFPEVKRFESSLSLHRLPEIRDAVAVTLSSSRLDLRDSQETIPDYFARNEQT